MSRLQMTWIVLMLFALGSRAVAQVPSSPLLDRTAQSDTGTRPAVPYDGTHENVSLITGNLNIKIPLLHLPGRNGLDLDLHLEYDSRVWHWAGGYDADSNTVGGPWEVEVRQPDVALGWHFNVPTINSDVPSIIRDGANSPIGCLGSTTVMLPDGSRYSFRNNAGCAAVFSPNVEIPIMDTEEPDGAQLNISNPNDVVLSLANGTKVHFNGISESGASYIVDANGNKITYSATFDRIGNITYMRLDSITDSLGRVISFTNRDIKYYDSTGTETHITLNWGTFPAPAPCPPVGWPPPPARQPVCAASTNVTWEFPIPYTRWTVSPAVLVTNNPGQDTPEDGLGPLTGVHIAGMKHWSFEYNSLGELTKIIYPTGGYTRYEYGSQQHAEFMVPHDQWLYERLHLRL